MANAGEKREARVFQFGRGAVVETWGKSIYTNARLGAVRKRWEERRDVGSETIRLT